MVYNNIIYYGKGINKLLIKNMLYVLMLLSYTHTTPKSVFQKKQNTTYIYIYYIIIIIYYITAAQVWQHIQSSLNGLGNKLTSSYFPTSIANLIWTMAG